MSKVNVLFSSADGATPHLVIMTPSARYSDSIANFETDANRTIPNPPAGVTSLRYDDEDGRLIVSTGDAQREVQAANVKMALDWMIGAIDSLLAAQAARKPPSPGEPPADSWAARFAALESQMATAISRIQALEAKVGP